MKARRIMRSIRNLRVWLALSSMSTEAKTKVTRASLCVTLAA